MKKTGTAKHEKKLLLSTHAIRLLRPARLDGVAGGEQCDGGTSGLSERKSAIKKSPI